jgi:dTDP-4-dehydrorhamnose reductase
LVSGKRVLVAAAKEMKWLITGANGQLGRCLQKTLDAQGCDFVALSRIDLDITNIDQLKEIVNDISPDIILNAAAFTNVEQAEIDFAEAFKINELGAANVAIASKLAGAKLVHFSTDYVFAGNGHSPWQANDLTEPLSIYGKSKLAGEKKILTEYSENSLIIRTAWLYSSYGNNFYKTMLTKALNTDENVKVVNDQMGQPTSALDLAELTVKAFSKSVTSGVFHGTNAGSCSWFEFAQYIFEIAGESPARVVPVLSSEFITTARRPKYSVLDNKKWSEFGISPLGPWKESVRKMLPDMMQSLAK